MENKYLVKAVIETVLNKEINESEKPKMEDIVNGVMKEFKIDEMPNKEIISADIFKQLNLSLSEDNWNSTEAVSDADGHDLCDDAALYTDYFKDDKNIAQNHTGVEGAVKFGNFDVITGLKESIASKKAVVVFENDEYYFVKDGIYNKIKALNELNVEIEIVNERTYYILTKRDYKMMSRFNESELKNIHEFAVSCGKSVLANFKGNKILVKTR